VLTSHDMTSHFDEFLDNHNKIRNHETHYHFCEDLVAHLWQHLSNLYGYTFNI
jgi:hypothetical protein